MVFKVFLQHPVRGGLGYWCCTDGSTSPDIENPEDRVEVSRPLERSSFSEIKFFQVAFRRLDFNRDGYLTEEDFLEVLCLKSWGLKYISKNNHKAIVP